MDYSFLYFGTVAMIAITLSIVFFVLWASSALKKQRQYLEQRDKHYLQRIEVVEKLVKNEFKIITEHLKNLST